MRNRRKSNNWFLLLLFAGLADLYLEHSYFDEHKLAPLRLHLEVARFNRSLTSTYFWVLTGAAVFCLLAYLALSKRRRF